MQTRGTLQARIQPDGLEVAFTDSIGGTVLTYGGLKAWDADSKPLAVRFDSVAANDSGLRVVVEETGARYPIIIDPVARQAYLKASNTEANDLFGWSVAVSGDTVVVGTVGEDSVAVGVNGDQANNSLPSSGAAYVFVRSGNASNQQAYLKASNPGRSDRFGWAVAISGDTILVGAPDENSRSTGVNRNWWMTIPMHFMVLLMCSPAAARPGPNRLTSNLRIRFNPVPSAGPWGFLGTPLSCVG